MNTPRMRLAAVTGLDGLIYAIGGFNSDGPVSRVEAYDFTLDKWVYKTSLPAASYALAAAVDPKGLIYAIGGADASNDPQPNVYSYDPSHPFAEWTEQDPLLTAVWSGRRHGSRRAHLRDRRGRHRRSVYARAAARSLRGHSRPNRKFQ